MVDICEIDSGLEIHQPLIAFEFVVCMSVCRVEVLSFFFLISEYFVQLTTIYHVVKNTTKYKQEYSQNHFYAYVYTKPNHHYTY